MRCELSEIRVRDQVVPLGEMTVRGVGSLRGAAAWAPYERLLEEVPFGRRVAGCTVGLMWTLLTSDAGDAGVSLTFAQGLDESTLPGTICGRDLRDVAGMLRSWNYYEASVGCAALNAVCNTCAHVQEMTGRPMEEFAVGDVGLFQRLAREFAGARVAVIGHFRNMEILAASCDLTVLERRPSNGDTPDPACEYVLPEQDVVLITGTTVTNKTLPRLLELSKGAYIALVGPSTPISPVWFDYGVDLLAGSVLTDPHGVLRCVQEGAHRRAFREGLTAVEIPATALALR